MTSLRWINPVLALVVVGVAGCESLTPQGGRAVVSYPAVEKIEPVSDPARISPAQFAEVIPRIAYVRAEPTLVELRVDEQLSRQDIKLFAFDAEGRTLGHLAIYDSSMEPGAAVLEARAGIRARHAGESDLVLAVPLWRASGGKGMAPEARVRIIVRP